MASSPNFVNLPVVTIQPTVGEVLDDVDSGMIPSEKFWVSCYKTGEQSVHTKINVELDEKDRNLVQMESEDKGLEVGVERKDGVLESYRVSASSLRISKARVIPPRQEYIDAETSDTRHPKRIEAFDMSPDGSRFAAGFLDGSVVISPTSPLKAGTAFSPEKVSLSVGSKLVARPHASGVSSVQFFPSSRVLLTAGLDFTLSILPAELPENATASTAKTVEAVRVLRGHKRAVTSTGILGVGRNILSSSLDSTIKLWDVPSGAEIRSVSTTSSILSTSIGRREQDIPDANPTDDREVPEVQQSVVFAGLQSGCFEIIDLATKKSTFCSQTPARAQQLTSIAYSNDHHTLATGSNLGIVTLYDIRSLAEPLTSFARQDGEILGLAAFTTGPSKSLGLAVATSDGLPFVARVGSDGTVEAEELIGVDCDPVRQVKVLGGDGNQEEIWLSSDDSVVRRYIYPL